MLEKEKKWFISHLCQGPNCVPDGCIHSGDLGTLSIVSCAIFNMALKIAAKGERLRGVTLGVILRARHGCSILSLLLIFHWLELNYMAILTCKGGWERLSHCF